MTCPVDSAGKNLCMEMMRNNMIQLGRAEGVNCRVIISDTAPADPDDWDAPYYCFHLVQYWVRPTDDQLTEWGSDGVNVADRLAERGQEAIRLTNEAITESETSPA